MKEIGNIIRQKRLSFGWSMEKLAHKSGLTCKSVLNIEHGEPSTLKSILAILETLNMEFIIKDKED